MTTQLIAGAGLVGAFVLATTLEPWFQTWAGNRAESANVLQVALGDARKLLARQLFIQADVYFHSGYYPSIFDRKPDGEIHVASAVNAGSVHAAPGGASVHDDMPDFLGQPRDWLDAFSRSFFPTNHAHLGHAEEPGGHGNHDGHDPESGTQDGGGNAREILPWLRLAADMDPEQAQTYVIAAYWLRSKVNRPDEAEQFLREGMQANPGNEEILFELGRIYSENRHDTVRARNVWEMALKNWRLHTAGQPEVNLLTGAMILGHLAKLEENERHYDRALGYLRELAGFSPNQAAIQKWIADVRSKRGAAK